MTKTEPRKSVKAVITELERKNLERRKTYMATIALQKEFLENLAESLERVGIDLEAAASGIGSKMRRDSERVSSRRFKPPRSWYG